MILLLRGHVRNAFDDSRLYELIKQLYATYKISIYIHTWNIQQSNVSWRPIGENKNTVSEELIYTYFKELKDCIKHIIIDDDSKIKSSPDTTPTPPPTPALKKP